MAYLNCVLYTPMERDIHFQQYGALAQIVVAQYLHLEIGKSKARL